MRVPHRAHDMHVRGYVPTPRYHRGTSDKLPEPCTTCAMDATNANEDLSEENSMHAETTYTFDENSGCTVATSEPWREALHKCKACKQGQTSAEIPAAKTTGKDPTHQPTGIFPSPQQRCPLPPSPEDHYKVICMPKPGMKLLAFREEEISASLAQACGTNFPEICQKVISQTQWP